MNKIKKFSKKTYAGIRNTKRIISPKSFFSEEKLARNNIYLFLSLFALVFLRPVINAVEKNQFVFNSLLTISVITGIASLDFDKKKLIRLTFAGIFTLFWIWLQMFFNNLELNFIKFFVMIVFYLYVTYSMILHVAKRRTVNATLILNAINSYLLLGIISGMLFILANVIYRFAFGVNNATIVFNYTKHPTVLDYIYYAFITMTTVGYGDAVPAVPLTKSLAMLTAITGQLYLSVLVAMLVGKFLSKENNGAK